MTLPGTRSSDSSTKRKRREHTKLTSPQVPFRSVPDNADNPIILRDLSSGAEEEITLFRFLYSKTSESKSLLDIYGWEDGSTSATHGVGYVNRPSPRRAGDVRTLWDSDNFRSGSNGIIVASVRTLNGFPQPSSRCSGSYSSSSDAEPTSTSLWLPSPQQCNSVSDPA